jgi:hypothetical protein
VLNDEVDDHYQETFVVVKEVKLIDDVQFVMVHEVPVMVLELLMMMSLYLEDLMKDLNF